MHASPFNREVHLNAPNCCRTSRIPSVVPMFMKFWIGFEPGDGLFKETGNSKSLCLMVWFLLGALTKCIDVLIGKSPQVAYRLNMICQQLNLDQLPTAETILNYSEHVQAEAEELSLSVPAKATSAVKAAALGVPPLPGIPQNPQNPQNESETEISEPKKGGL